MEFAIAYHAAKDQVVEAFGATHAMMHLHAGLALYLCVQLLTRTRRGSLQALSVVFLAEMGNEILDRLATGSWRWSDTVSDVVLTLMWPAAITAVSLYRRARWTRHFERQRMAHRMLHGGYTAAQAIA